MQWRRDAEAWQKGTKMRRRNGALDMVQQKAMSA
jgi:hypothetical protein